MRASSRSPRRAASLPAMRRALEAHLKRTLSDHASAPARVGAAMRYAALSPGKRIRPLLALAACDAVGGEWRRALPAAAAIECVHAFSLVHDDLPAMDDDDFRRGRPTTHRRFGEALGVLAGDALLAFAFEELGRLPAHGVAESRALECVRRLAVASGARELIAGQAMDVAAEGRRAGTRRVRAIHERKTGALLGAALALGAICGGAGAARTGRLQTIGVQLGLAFQIHDDLLNAGSSLRRLGKRPGTDAARGKATYVSAAGADRSRTEAQALFAAARAAVARECARPAALLELIAATAARDR